MSQADLDRFTEGERLSEYTPLQLDRQVGGAAAREELEAWGLDAEWVGKQPGEVPYDTFYRYQFNRTYYYPVADYAVEGGGNAGREQVYFPIEFRTYICTVGEPSNQLKRHIAQTDNPRLRYLFDSGPYESWMSNFNFEYHDDFVEDEQVAADQVNNLGIPQFEVEVKKNGTTKGMANGFFDPFRMVKRVEYEDEPPEQEIWNITSFNESRGDYQIAPPGRTAARQRASNIRGKTVYINGAEVGSVTTDGRVWLKKEYANDSQVYRGDHSREWLVQNTDATYSAIRRGGNLYKTRETSNGVYLVTARAKPDDFTAASPETVSPTGGLVSDEEIRLRLVNENEPTEFTIRRDRGELLGKYADRTVREVAQERDWNTRYAPW